MMPVTPLLFSSLSLLIVLILGTVSFSQTLDDASLDRRIDALRCKDLTITLPADVTISSEDSVAYELLRHDFEFGTAISSRMIGAPDAVFTQKQGEADKADFKKYQQIAQTYFTAAVCENAMKWPMMENRDGQPVHVDRAMYVYDWCTQNNLKLRGHNIFWGIPKWLPKWQKELAQQPPAVIEKRMKARLAFVLNLFAGKITEWDLNNEMMHQDIFAEGMQWENQAQYFKWATSHSPDVAFYVNEYGVLQGNEIQRYVKHIQELLDAGAQIGGIGDQAHFFKPIPENQKIWDILDQLGQFDLPVKITEFDLGYKGMTAEEQAQQLRRFYRVCFAHPAVDGIYMWGFWQGAHWRPQSALWDQNWNPTPAAKAYIKLIKEDWHTQGTAKPNRQNQIQFRGFPGMYNITVNGQTHHIHATHQ